MPPEIIEHEGHHYIRVGSSQSDERARVLKHDDTFAVFDHLGDVRSAQQGVFHEGTRHLSRLSLLLAGARPLLLSSAVDESNETLTVDLTNADVMGPDGHITIPRGVLHVLRERFLWRGCSFERLRFANYGLTFLSIPVRITFGADFADIFEVRGTPRAARGQLEPARVDAERVRIAYRGLDDVVRTTVVGFEPRPAQLTADDALFELAIAPHAATTIVVAVSCGEGEPGEGARVRADCAASGYASARAAARAAREAHDTGSARLHSSHAQLNRWIDRSISDLHMLTTHTEHGPYPYAGVPWFSTVFGRDGIITALELLWLDPRVARGVLGYLAATQATTTDDAREAEPGKVLHETRTGEMAALHEVPFGRYYGSVDATPLFVMLAGEYLKRTDDLPFVETLWPALERALGWLDERTARDPYGFVTYEPHGDEGLIQQGWKDSRDSVFHADGTLAEPPIALCEVQGYAYAARSSGAVIAERLGRRPAAERLRAAAERLRLAFETAFWCDERSTYALALDRFGRRCSVATSNAAHCLFAGIASPDRAARVAVGLLEPELFSGWGLRTLSTRARRYNPMSYHNGSVWPHDNAMAAVGVGRYGHKRGAVAIFEALFEAATFLDQFRLPELFCGLARRPDEGPTLYPVACLPQAWASGAVFMLVAACLGLSVDAARGEVRLEDPMLPRAVDELEITNLAVGRGSVDLLLQRAERGSHDVRISVLRRDGPVRVVSQH